MNTPLNAPMNARAVTRATMRATGRNHRIVVGIVVGLIAVAGIGSVIVNANRHGVVRNTSNSATPAAAYPDSLAPQAGQATSLEDGSAPAVPPPASDNPLPPAASAAEPAASPPVAGATPPAASATPPSSSGAARGTVDQGPAGESAVVTVSSKLESDRGTTATAFGNGRLASDVSAQVPSEEQARASGADAANADRQITSLVQSQIAADSTTQRSAL